MLTSVLEEFCDNVLEEFCDNIDCEQCSEEYLRYSWCCLFECGQHEFCAGCDRGIYGEKLKE